MFWKFWGKNFLINHYKPLIVSSKRSERKKNQHFQTLKNGQNTCYNQNIFSPNYEIPWLSWYLKFPWPICKIPWLFPDLEGKSNFPDFSLTSGHPVYAAYQLSRSSAFRFQRRRFLKVFTIYGHGGHLGHVTWTIWPSFRSPIPRRLHMKFGFNQPFGYWRSLKILNLRSLDQGQWMTLTFGTNKLHVHI